MGHYPPPGPRHMATRPPTTKNRKPYYRRSAEIDHAKAATFTIFLALFVGGLIGASIAIGVMT